MSVRIHRSERSRHLFLRAPAGETLPSALIAGLREEHVTCGWLRASGVLADVELSAFDAAHSRLGEPRRIAGPVHVISLEGSIGLSNGEPTLSLRAVLARENDRGLETIAGEIVSARTIALEALVTVFDDLVLERAYDAVAGVSLLDSSASGTPSPAAPNLPRAVSATTKSMVTASTATSWSAAADVSAQTDREPTHVRSAAVSATGTAPIPQRPGRPGVVNSEVDAPVPEPGDVVDHFAFGRADVLKSDGDRLHLRVHKDGKIREIALEMLRVSRLDGDETGRRFKLERRI